MADTMLNQVDLVAGILKLIGEQFTDIDLCPRQLNAVIEAANLVVREVASPIVPADRDSGLAAWLKSDDVGMSSEFMAHVLAGGPPCDPAHPRDPDDFGRCVRFLAAVPEARSRLELMKNHGDVWSALVDHWAEFEAMYKNVKNGELPEKALYYAMRDIGC